MIGLRTHCSLQGNEPHKKRALPARPRGALPAVTTKTMNAVGMGGGETKKLGELVVPLNEAHFGDYWLTLNNTPSGKIQSLRRVGAKTHVRPARTTLLQPLGRAEDAPCRPEPRWEETTATAMKTSRRRAAPGGGSPCATPRRG